MINQYYWYRMRAEDGAAKMHSLITHFAPGDPGYVIDVSGAAVLKSSKHQAEAQKFLAFLVSRKAQEIIARLRPASRSASSTRWPPGSRPRRRETPFSQLQPYPITIAQLGTGTTAIELMRQAGLL